MGLAIVLSEGELHVADLSKWYSLSFRWCSSLFKCGGADIVSDMTMRTECLKESALVKNGAGESALRRRASCSWPFQVA